MQPDILIIAPGRSEDDFSEALRTLTEHLVKSGQEPAPGGIFGGEFGYGVEFENDVFMMHHFCWCEREDCDWCIGCACPEDATTYTVDGVRVTFAEWARADNDRRDWEIVTDKQCAYCKREVEPAPNFLYKPTGATVHWYKYIGRGMEVEGDFPADFLERCIESV